MNRFDALVLCMLTSTLYVNLVCGTPMQGTCLATASGDGTVKLWDFKRAACSVTFEDHTAAVWDVAWHYGGDFVASCSMDHTTRLWDMHSERCRQTFRGTTAVTDTTFDMYFVTYCAPDALYPETSNSGHDTCMSLHGTHFSSLALVQILGGTSNCWYDKLFCTAATVVREAAVFASVFLSSTLQTG